MMGTFLGIFEENMRDEIQSIFRGTGPDTAGNRIQTARAYLAPGPSAGGTAEKTVVVTKKEQTALLTELADKHNLWYDTIDFGAYIGEGAEQRVYLQHNGRQVIKLNDAVFYENWQDYFVSLLIHNLLFPATAYELLGFHTDNGTLYAVVQQPFIISTEPVDLDWLRVFLENNGFVHKRNHDFFHPDWGIILEDLHDENVLVNEGVFFVIDSAIYRMD